MLCIVFYPRLQSCYTAINVYRSCETALAICCIFTAWGEVYLTASNTRILHRIPEAVFIEYEELAVKYYHNPSSILYLITRHCLQQIFLLPIEIPAADIVRVTTKTCEMLFLLQNPFRHIGPLELWEIVASCVTLKTSEES